jgi:2-polyprenyl-6-methoxyphenol hydroxylase-like FAD-dependent oxidoreductase
VLFEPQSGPHDKPCGEGILGEGVRALEDLGVRTIATRSRAFGAIRYCIAGLEPLRVSLPSDGAALPRPILMDLLGAEIASTSSIRLVAARAEAVRVAGGFELSAVGGIAARALFLAVADGAGGTSAPWLREPRSERRASYRRGRFGIRARFESAEQLTDVEVHLGKECEVYLTPLPDGWMNVAALFERAPRDVHGTAQILEAALEQHPLARSRLGALLGRPEARSLDHALPLHTSDGESFLVGDAGGGIDPILGCGVSVALRSGIEAARSARARMDGRPRERVRENYEHFYAHEVRARRALSSFLRAAARHAALARVLVRVARASPLVTRSLVRIAAGGISESGGAGTRARMEHPVA